MQNGKVCRASFAICTTPFFLAAALVYLLKYKPLMSDLEKCLDYINNNKRENSKIINENLIRALVCAEDHRNHIHFGIDPIAITRAFKIKLFNKTSQGASTIEQQFVRTITKRYEKTPRRKIREQILAVMISLKESKRDISKSYLSCAYYGTGLIGSSGLMKIKEMNKKLHQEKSIAYLKYPKPEHRNIHHNEKHKRRYLHIINLLNREPTIMIRK
ncbi:TPA: transglycosylase domain-containing protein [Serratia marcescens]